MKKYISLGIGIILSICILSFSNSGHAQTTTPSATGDTRGIKLDCFRNGTKTCGVNVYEMLDIKDSNKEGNVEIFMQDIVLSATMFFGTVFSIVILFSGFLYIISAIQGSDTLQNKAKKGLIGGIIGFLLVSGAFGIVRFIQFLAQGGT